jgi:hypothetical protein
LYEWRDQVQSVNKHSEGINAAAFIWECLRCERKEIRCIERKP